MARQRRLDVVAWRRLATVVGLVLFTLALLLSLTRCGSSGVCFCPIGFVCVLAEGGKTWHCEPSPMPPTWLAGQRDGGVEEVSE